MADSPVKVYENAQEVKGQQQVPGPELHDGTHLVHEVVAVTDRVILDPSSPEAVQIPEGVGASTYGHRSPLGEALQQGTPQEQFDRAAEDSEPEENQEQVQPEDTGDAAKTDK